MTEIVITDFDQASKALRMRDLRQGLYDEGAVLMDRVLLNLHGDEHKVRRGLENKVFRRDFFRYYEQEVFPASLKQAIERFVAAGGGDLVDFGFRAMMNLTIDFAGVDRPDQTVEESDTLLRLLKSFALGTTLAHSKEDRDMVRQQVRDALAEFDGRFLQPSIARRQALLDEFSRGELDEEDLPRDVLTVLLRNEDRIDLPDDVLLREMAYFYVAGAQTSIHSLVHVMHEIFEWTTAHPEGAEKIRHDPVLIQRCVHESARLHPSSPIAARRSECPMTLPNEENIDEGEQVIIDLRTANRNKGVFGEDADTFDPYRQLDASTPTYGLSFGLGMHACIGRNLAAGVLPRTGELKDNHQFGIITLTAQALLANGVQPDPDNSPQMDTKTERPNWGVYPVLFSKDKEAS